MPTVSLPLRIGDLIEVPPVQTVIRLEDGRTQPESIAGSFVFTAEVAAHFAVLTDAFLRDRGRGYFLQGDFGSGKSHFLTSLAAWLSGAPGAEVLTERHEGLRRLRDRGGRLLAVPVSLVRYRATTSLEQILVEAVEEALERAGEPCRLTPLSIFLAHLAELLREPANREGFAELAGIDPAEVPGWLESHRREAFSAGMRWIERLGLARPEALVEDRHETFARILEEVASRGFRGVVLLLDELSEFFRSKPDARRLNEDARTLQFLGELTASAPLWIVAAVQESIERTGDIAQVTFRKIKDRFPVKLALSTLHIRELLSQRLVRRKPGADEAIRRIYEDFRRQFPTFGWPFDHFRDVYPVHPATLALLEGLSDLFSEHRGIVDFVHSQVAGDPQRRIPGILDRPCHELLAPDSIYDHFASRLQEFSAFNVYPRHVVPHLDRVIETEIEEEEDRALARRLVRVLVLYQIHPTAEPPTVRGLTELAACLLGDQDPDLSVQFVAEALLDRIVAASRFLVRRPAPSGDPLEATYRVVTRDDPGKTLEARLRHVQESIGPEDTRLLVPVLAELPASMGWPGPELLDAGMERTVSWRGSSRRCLALFCAPGGEAEVHARVRERLEAGVVDFALVVGVGDSELRCEHAAFWRVPVPGDDALLREYLAARLLREELRPENPADAPLIDLAEEAAKRRAPAAAQAALGAVFEGEFLFPEIPLDPTARQLKRFDRLVEAAGEHLLEARYPRFARIAPRGVTPSPRLYQRLLEEWVIPGSLSLHAARERRLAEVVEGLAVPLGLVELRSGSYVFAPDLQAHPLLAALLGRLRPAAPTPLPEVLEELGRGPFGVPRDTAAFLLASLACAGIVSLLKRGRTLPLEFLHLASVETAEAVALGELLSPADRQTLMEECGFLAPAGGWEAFGLRQQREAWQAALKLKEKTGKLLEELHGRLEAVGDYSAFQALDREGVRRTLQAARDVLAEIKVSYPAREGLERFLAAWRGRGLTAEQLEGLRGLHRFLTRDAEQVIFIHHYVRHAAAEAAAEGDPELEALRAEVLERLESPELFARPEEAARLGEAFARFRDAYGRLYAEAHGAYHQRVGPAPLGKGAKRALEVLRRLASIDRLDQPPGLAALLRQVDGPQPQPCRRRVEELLLRAPLCDCGFQLGQAGPAPAQAGDLEGAIDACVAGYREILGRPEIQEALEARAYALKDASGAAAERLQRLLAAVRGGAAVSLVDLVDAATAEELGAALAGRVSVEHRSLADLAFQLAGRRLQPGQVQEVVAQWLSAPETGTVVALEGAEGTAPQAAPSGPPLWWEVLSAPLLGKSVPPPNPRALQTLASRLERHYPAARLRPTLQALENEGLLAFVAGERFHTQAVREAWLLLAERVLTGEGRMPDVPEAVLHADPEVAGRVHKRLATLAAVQGLRGAPLPEGLRLRLPLVSLFQDPWATDRVQRLAEEGLAALDARAGEWAALLPPLEPLELDRRITVVVIDAVPPDVWLEAAARCGPLLAGAVTSLSRLEAAPVTGESLAALFGLCEDALEGLAPRGATYHRAQGNEAAGLLQQLPPPSAEGPVVVHLGLFDRSAHRGTLDLPGMPDALVDLLDRELRPVLEACRSAGRRLAVTTDHGLSFTRRGLAHGAGGPFERVVFRALWEPVSGDR
ncbi:MAG: hypothetical protein Kow0092_20900 [Deferrisomatales bacterium]